MKTTEQNALLKLFLFFTLTLGTVEFSSHAYATGCDLLLRKLDSIHPKLATISEQIKGLEPNLILGNSTPRWEDFEKIDKIVQDLKQTIDEIRNSKKLNSLKDLYPEFENDFTKSKLWTEIETQKQIAEGSKLKYAPTEYELKVLYRKSVEQLNEYLPKDIRFKLQALPKDTRPKELLKEATRLMKHLKTSFDSYFFTTGHKTLESYRKAMAESVDSKTLNELLALLKNEEFEITMRRPENGRWWTPKVGFQNQYVTGSSKGYYTPVGRNNIESACLDFDRDAYSAFDSELKPKYGSIRPLPGKGYQPNVGESFYGDDIYILKKARLKKRITFSPGDTNNRATTRKKFPNKDGRVSPRWEDADFKTQSWDDLFIPWDYRELLAPIFKSSFQHDLTFGSPGAPLADELKLLNSSHINSYTEIQVWGPLTLDDVEIFEFTQNPPEGAFLEELINRGIQIRDGRQWPPKIWTH